MSQTLTTPIITGTNITKVFGTGHLTTTVLRGVDITVYEGEFVAIMGKSGAGKSTLMYQLSVLDTPSGGTITIAGTETTTLAEEARPKFRLNTLGYVFHDYAQVPDLSAEENVLLPLMMRGVRMDDARAIAHQAIDSVGLPGKYRNLPSELSGGEQQRIAIARAVAGKPRILFADEPTANLDSVSGEQIITLLTKLNRDFGQTIVMVTHEREYAQSADRIINMEDGKIVDEEKLTHS
ncbi:MAG: ABC transporter ATP-binding protein [Candidatus Pacebacteria bacterium]|nr:ABC transporter ATP-binding protein [Candidatus Paceibacterota bacterium]